ncbi:general substrate transporter [Xylariales sp. PMI_506]|nr:general substrate transporter [Xylariales sp. PMI_506]
MELTTSAGIAQGARLATEEEHNLGFWEAIKRHKMACFWSAVVSLTIIMDGYDTALLGSLQAYPSFQRQFGEEVGTTGSYQVPAPWQVALTLSNPVGNIVGIFINSALTERFGHKRSLQVTLIFLAGVIFIPFFAKSLRVIFVGELLCGLCWGVFTTMAPAYASEVCPVVLRSYLETFVVLCWGIGQFVSYGVLAGLANETSDPWSWRIPIAVQWAWVAIIFPLVLFAPESPWWLVRKDRIAEAEKVVMRLSRADEAKAKQSVALMIHTNNLEKAMTEGSTVLDCFKGTNLWRTEISCATWALQQFCGFVITGYATYFYEQAGLPATQAFHMSVGQAGLHFVCTLIAFPLCARVGRRPLLLWGQVGMCITMLIIGFISLAPQSNAQGYGESAVYLVWYAVYELSIGPGAYIVVGETSTTRLRSHTVGLARNTYNIVNIINSIIGPYILNPTEGNWKGKCGFLTGGLIIFCIIWTYFRLPEMSGRTYEELDILFSMDISARDFAKQPLTSMPSPNYEKL